mgnify:CR=1 FL=1
MCGLVGYIGNNAVAETLLNGLKNLEYRGYDSAGIALNDNNAIDVFKAKGKLNNLSTVLAENSSKLVALVRTERICRRRAAFSVSYLVCRMG